MKNKRIRFAAPMLAVSMAFSAPIAVYASQEDVAAVVSAIDNLPAVEDLNASYADMVKNVWDAYSNLTTAEKITVSNSEKLIKEYDKLVNTGVLKDEKKEEESAQKDLDEQRAGTQISGTEESQVTDYTFDYDPKKPISVVVRYTTDADGDGKGDVPGRITLTSPHADTYPVTNTNTKLSDDGLTVGLSWENNFVQMDFAKATDGKWTISTSIPCTFTAIDYAGAKQDISYDGEQAEKKKDTSKKDTKKTAETPKPEKKSSIFLPAVLIFIVAGLIGGLIAFYKKFWPKSSGNPKNPAMDAKERKAAEEEDIYETEEPRPMSDEEIIAQMRAEYKESVARQRQMEEADEELSRNATVEEDDDYTDLDEVTQEDFDNDETIEEYTEGDTGLLSQKDNPTSRKSGNSFFDDDDDDF